MKKNRTSFFIILITIMLLGIIGGSYAYFIGRINIENNGENSTTIINTATIASVEYTSNSNLGDSNITIDNSYPGKYGFLEFTLTANTKSKESTTYYKVIWDIEENEFKYLNGDNGEICESAEGCEAQVYYALYDGKVNLEKTPYTDPGGTTYDIFKGVTDGKLIEYNSQTIKNDITAKTGEIVLDVGSLTAAQNMPGKRTYTLIVWFEETGHNQNNNQGK